MDFPCNLAPFKTSTTMINHKNVRLFARGRASKLTFSKLNNSNNKHVMQRRNKEQRRGLKHFIPKSSQENARSLANKMYELVAPMEAQQEIDSNSFILTIKL